MIAKNVPILDIPRDCSMFAFAVVKMLLSTLIISTLIVCKFFPQSNFCRLSCRVANCLGHNSLNWSLERKPKMLCQPSFVRVCSLVTIGLRTPLATRRNTGQDNIVRIRKCPNVLETFSTFSPFPKLLSHFQMARKSFWKI